jgi:hypothetical protein
MSVKMKDKEGTEGPQQRKGSGSIDDSSGSIKARIDSSDTVVDSAPTFSASKPTSGVTGIDHSGSCADGLQNNHLSSDSGDDEFFDSLLETGPSDQEALAFAPLELNEDWHPSMTYLDDQDFFLSQLLPRQFDHQKESVQFSAKNAFGDDGGECSARTDDANFGHKKQSSFDETIKK